MMFKKILQYLSLKYFRKFTTLSTVYALFFSFGLGAVLGVGPYLQSHFMAVLNGTEPGIYSSVYGDSLIKFPAISDWILNLNVLLFSFVSLVLFVVARRFSSVRDIFINVAISFFVISTMIDGYVAVTTIGAKVPVNFWECLVSNLIGGPLVAGLVLLVLQLNGAILGFGSNSGVLLRAVALVTPVVCGVLISAISYLIFTLLFNPVPADFDIVLSDSASGYYMVNKNSKKIASDAADKPFGILSKSDYFDDVVTATSAGENIKLSWKNGLVKDKFTASIRFFKNCIGGELVQKQSKITPSLVVRDVNSIQIETDSGPNSIFIPQDKAKLSRISVSNEEGNMYWIEKDDKSKKITLSRFVDTKSNIKYWNSGNKFQVYLGAYLFDRDKVGNLVKHPRRFMVNVNGVKQNFSFTPMPSFDLNGVLKCQGITAKASDSNSHRLSDVIGLSLIIEPLNMSNTFYSNDSSVLLVSGVSGWVSARDLTSQSASNLSDKGSVDAVSFNGHVKSLYVNDSKVETSPFDSFTIWDGKLVGSVEGTGELHFKGTANSFLRGQKRFNQTRWERLDASIKLLIVTAMFSLFSTICVVVVNTIKANKPVKWF